MFDASPAFTPDGIYKRLAGYGEAGRQNYSFRNVTIDVLLPLSILPFLFLLTRRAVARFSLSPLVRTLLLSVPVVYVAFDLLENVAVLALLANYPERMNVLAASLPYTTVVKRAASFLLSAFPWQWLVSNSCAGDSRRPPGFGSSTGERVMAFYKERVLPYLVHWSMRQDTFSAYRRRVIPAAQGRVLEIGVGSGGVGPQLPAL